MSTLCFTPILHPPLGTTTVVGDNGGQSIRFYALMEAAFSFSEQDRDTEDPKAEVKRNSFGEIGANERFTVLLFWSVNGRGAWKPAPFREIIGEEERKKVGIELFDLAGNASDGREVRRDIFILDLEYTGAEPLQFSLKYSFSDGPWLWAGARIGGLDGRVVFQNRSTTPSSLLFENLFTGNEWRVETITSPETISANVKLWDVKTPVDGECALNFGRPIKIERWMALVKIAAPWMGPLHGTSNFSIYKDALLLLFQRQDGTNVAVLPVSGVYPTGATSYLTSDSDSEGRIIIKRCGDDEPGTGTQKIARVIVAIGTDIQDVVDEAYKYLKRLIMNGDGERKLDVAGAGPPGEKDGEAVEDTIRTLKTERETENTRRAVGEREHWDEGLAYCTWNGMGWDLSEARILNALEEIEKNGIRVCNLLIDDNWQSLADRNYGSSGTWSRFEANEKFPTGLKGFVNNVKTRFPYIRHIGVWHALHGYWDGVTPDGELAKKYRTVEVAWWDNVNSVNRPLTFVAPEDVGRFYDDFHRFLKESGIDGVKTDVQSRIDELTYSEDKGRLQRAYQDAFMNSSMKHFDRRVIYCMAHIPQILYYALLPDDKPKVFFRTSDDFYPNVPQSHAWHVFANTMNMMIYGRLNILPDWDMFQTALPTYASFHAAARCLSGGPIFITDTPGDHSVPVISSMTSLSPSNYTRSLRPSGMSLPVEPYSGYKSNRLLKISNVVDSVGAAVLGVFNVSNIALTEIMGLKELRGLYPRKEYILRGCNSGKIVKIGTEDRDEFIVVALKPAEWEVFTIVPVISTENLQTKVAALGLTRSITGIAAVEKVEVALVAEKLVVGIVVKALGLLSVYISDLPNRSLETIDVSVAGRNVPRWYFDKFSGNKEVLEICLLKAWEKLELRAVEEGSVDVKIMIGV
ncbi:hypothetical protein RUND412_007573 [Rhizina undulata]